MLHTCRLLKLNLTTDEGVDSNLYPERNRDSFSLVYGSRIQEFSLCDVLVTFLVSCTFDDSA